MWLFNEPPRALLRRDHQFEITPAWLEHLQKASIRFNNGGSGAFISADGLIVTNHHIGIDCVQERSSATNDLLADGYLAKARSEELKCSTLELNVLMSIEDVTARVSGGVTAAMSAADAEAKRRAAMNTIESESLRRTGLRSDVVTLYQGGAYHLYRYKKYTDVRLVFAPEEDAAFFGGDPDNFEYPRYNFDVCIFRAYENDRPAKVEHWLRWSTAGTKDGELVFVSGNPGGTERLNTASHLRFLRDVRDAFSLDRLRRMETALRAYSLKSAENARRASNELLNVENSRKLFTGELAALQDPALLAGRRTEDDRLRGAVKVKPELEAAYGDAWSMIDAAVAKDRALYIERVLFESAWGFDSALFKQARFLVRAADEREKPNAERLREYRQSNLPSLEESLLDDLRTFEDLDAVLFGESLSLLAEKLPDDPLVVQVLAGQSPRARAAELVRETTLNDLDARRALLEGGKRAVEASTDPMIRLARLVDARSRELRRRYEQEVEEPLRQAYAKIAHARFRTAGAEIYPDATFTLRLGFGTVRGYADEHGTRLPWTTTLGGLFARVDEHTNAEPYDLPRRWLDRRKEVAAATPYNFVSTVDTVGGSSGSPIVNRAGDLVGILFDGNLPSLGFSFAYQEKDARTIAVDVRAIVEVLRQVYDADELVKQLTRG